MTSHATMARTIRGIDWLGYRLALTLSLVSLLWSTALITNFSFNLIGPEKLGLVFNDMASRLLHLDMTIDPKLISFEAFVHDGRTYAYFGIFPALLRIPAILAGAGEYQLARISCLLALWIITFSTLRMTQGALGQTLRTRAARQIAAAALIGVSFSGPVIYVLASASIYHEAIFWGAAGTAAFNCIVVRRVCAGQALGSWDFTLLALAAGSTLLARMTCGVALYAGLALLLIWPTAMAFATSGMRAAIGALGSTLRMAAPALALATVFVGVQAAVNYGRWGNPLVALPFQDYQQVILDPHRDQRLARFMHDGVLDYARIPLAALYYGFGVKVDAVFPTFAREHFDVIEGPRVIAPLCVPWLILCTALGLRAMLLGAYRSGPLVALIIANGIGFLMILLVWALCLRYTFDGWGFLTLTAALGARWLVDRADSLPDSDQTGMRRLAHAAIAATLLGIVVSHVTLLRYKINYSGTTPAVRYWLSERIQPVLCPHTPLTPGVRLDDFIPLVTLTCPPLW